MLFESKYANAVGRCAQTFEVRSFVIFCFSLISRWDHIGFVLETLPGGDLFLCFCCVMLGFSLVVVVGREKQRERRGENRRRRGKMFVDC
jgi:hypothetical protein